MLPAQESPHTKGELRLAVVAAVGPPAAESAQCERSAEGPQVAGGVVGRGVVAGGGVVAVVVVAGDHAVVHVVVDVVPGVVE